MQHTGLQMQDVELQTQHRAFQMQHVGLQTPSFFDVALQPGCC